MSDFFLTLNDPEFSMDGLCLVEASAGTGKTYSIQNAYLRLLLEKERTVEQILVVTFTEAATHELRERLRRILSLARDVLSGHPGAQVQDLERVRSLLTAAGVSERDENALRTLRLAIMDFDRASIFTIHSFCQRVLARNAFECGQDLHAELLTSDSEILSEVCQDWWRRTTYGPEECSSGNPFKKFEEVRSLLQEAWKRRDGRLRPTLDNEAGAAKLKEGISQLSDALKSAKALLDAKDGFERTWNTSGTNLFEERLPEVLKKLEQGRMPVGQVDECLKILSDNQNGPQLTEQRTENPEEIQSLLTALSKLKREMGNKKSPSWSGGQLVNGGASFEVNRLEALSKKCSAQLDGYLKDFKPSNKPKAFKRIVDLLSQGLPADGSAADFFSDLKALDGVAVKQLFGPSKRALDEVFPEVMEAMESLNQFIAAQKGRIIDDLRKKVEEEIRSRSMLTYEDLLRGVQHALSGAGGPALKKVLREEYHAVMIDEFQDTDPVQYDIFSSIFDDEACPMLCVGDPKQAIYGFRGGDVFTYYKARQAVPKARLFSLSTNYRSEEGLIIAVNDLFKEEKASAVFLNPNITYRGDLKANGVEPAKRMSNNDTPLRILQFTQDEKGKPGIGSRTYQEVMDTACSEVVRLLQEETIAGKAVKPGQICFLVHAHSDAAHICKALRRRGVPVVQQNSGNVFDSEEAKALGLLLWALMEPTNRRAVRAVLAAGLLPCTPDQLHSMVVDEEMGIDDRDGTSPAPTSLEGWIHCLKEVAERWEQRSLVEALGLLDRRCGLRAWLAGREDGERRLTNLFHLIDLVHEVSTQRLGSASSLLDWYSRQLDSDQREESDAAELRLSTQKDAVKVMTVFKSKGLEFPVVFAPFLWRRRAEARSYHQKLAVCHDGNEDLQLHLDKQDTDANTRAKSEKIQEDVRLLYVALTRAVHRAYLFDVRSSVDLSGSYALDHLVDHWQRRDGRTATITLDTQPGARITSTGFESQGPAVGGLPEPEPREVDPRQRSTSFSALEPNTKDMNSVASRDWDGVDAAADSEDVPESAIFAIAGGKRTGNCWHDIFEHLDFEAGDAERTSLVKEKLDLYGICRATLPEVVQEREQAVQNMVQKVLTSPLSTAGSSTFRLCDVPMKHRRSELGFCFSLHRGAEPVRTSMIRDVLEKHWSGDPNRKPFLDALASWSRDLPQGYLSGFMDLVFGHEGRFYIIDWKSNRRSGQNRDFDQNGLIDEMARHSYFLQYLLYTVALDAHLTQTLEGYDYEQHFGGVFYLFLRGFEHEETKGCFSDRPPVELIRSLGRLLCAGEGG